MHLKNFMLFNFACYYLLFTLLLYVNLMISFKHAL
uniref:Uncharacterized protein n=1 Tax=Spyridia filamentosa TaxID=196632 RepID=A0A1Z1MJW3_SPYFI|nr:hypothetical protein [Spyridia filamentosa]ARW66132.1 hypothetical protein [Spyridia filamentosa]